MEIMGLEIELPYSESHAIPLQVAMTPRLSSLRGGTTKQSHSASETATLRKFHRHI